MKEPYAILGVSKSASADEIRRAYRKLAKELHPDARPGDKAAEERFKDVGQAFKLLSDPDAKAKYDRGEIDADGNERAAYHFRSRPGGPAGQRGPSGRFEDISDLFSDLFSEIGQGGRQGAAGGAPPGQGEAGGQGGPAGDCLIEVAIRPHAFFRRDGADVRVDLPITLKEALFGGAVRAPTVDGPVEVRVPAGANSGAQLRLRGKGAPKAGGGQGDQIIKLIIDVPMNDPSLESFIEDWEPPAGYDPRKRFTS